MDRVIAGVLSAKTRVVVTSFAPCVAAAQRVITLEGGQAIHGGGAEAARYGHLPAADARSTWAEDERWQVCHALTPSLELRHVLMCLQVNLSSNLIKDSAPNNSTW